MGKITGFLEFDRKDETYAPVKERIKNYKEFTKPLKEKESRSPLYGLWHSILSQWLSPREFNS